MPGPTLNTPDRPWSYRRSIIDRFELQPGDHWTPDAPTSERCELVHPDPQPFDTDITVTMGLRVTADLIDATWTVIGQFRATDDPDDYRYRSPVFAQELYSSRTPGCCRFVLMTRGTSVQPATGNTAGVPRYVTDTFTLGTWHTLEHRIRFSAGGDGHLDSWLDGNPVITDLTAPIGYTDTIGPRWKYGAYRSAGSSHPVVVEYADLTITPV